MVKIPGVRIVGADDTPMILSQGGMGIGVSLAPLASAVAQEGGIGTVSSAALSYLHWKKYGQRVSVREATRFEIVLAKAEGGFVAINCMVALAKDYEESVLGALDARVDAIVSGGGLPLALPKIANKYQLDHPDCSVALIPIVSSVKALEVIFKHWERKNRRHPDAVVLEGPLAGGHLGFSFSDIDKKEHQLENLFPAVKKFAEDHGGFPVIVAGGIFDNEGIVRWAKNGADGVQLGSRFAVTRESNASAKFKQAVIDSKKRSTIVAQNPGSPCGLPFRIIESSPGYWEKRQTECTKGLLSQQRGDSLFCPAKNDPRYFCICNGLLAALGLEADLKPIYTIGAEGWRITEILSAKELIYELGVRH